MNLRTWAAGDNEPGDLPPIIDAYGDRWWCQQSSRTDRSHDGWRSNMMGFFDESKAWWWLTMYRGPLTEEKP